MLINLVYPHSPSGIYRWTFQGDTPFMFARHQCCFYGLVWCCPGVVCSVCCASCNYYFFALNNCACPRLSRQRRGYYVLQVVPSDPQTGSLVGQHMGVGQMVPRLRRLQAPSWSSVRLGSIHRALWKIQWFPGGRTQRIENVNVA